MKFYIIDGSSYCYRAYHALPALSNSKGQPTGAVYGFVSMLKKLLEEKPDYMAVCFDLKGPTFRHKKFAGYKIQRPPMPEELVSQLDLIREAISAFRIPVFAMEGYEADDVIATLASRWAGKEIEVYLVTGDKDMLQMVNPHIKVYNTQTDGQVYDEERIMAHYGVTPGQVPEVLALMGDSTDNIPGVPGIGEKTATGLIKRFKSIEGLYAHLDDVEKKTLRESLTEYREQAEEALELLRVRKDVPVEAELEDLKCRLPDDRKLFEVFRKLEFKNLMKELPALEELSTAACDLSESRNEDNLFELLKGRRETVIYLNESEGGKTLALALEEGTAFYLTLLENGRDTKDELFSGALSSDASEKRAGLLEKLKTVLEEEDVKKTGHDLKSLKLSLLDSGVELKGLYFDTMLASYLIDTGKSEYALEDLGLDYFGNRVKPGASLKESGQNAANACHLIFKLKEKLEAELAERSLDGLYFQVELPLIDVLTGMEKRGVKLDVEELSRQSEALSGRLNSLTKEIYEIAGCEFNINSPKQLSQVLFEKLKLPVLKRTKTGASTDVQVLEKLAERHALPAVLLKYRELAKLKSTYIDALPRLVSPKDGRLHTTFNQAGTVTGRLSSSNPNLQNIPVKTEEGRVIRRAFVAGGPGWLLVSADYSQIELRILAHLSGDLNLKEAFRDGRDIHTDTASLIYKVAEEKVTKDMRSAAKTVNFGIIYGMSPYGLAQGLNISVEEAQVFIQSYFERYPGVQKFLDGMIAEVREKGYATTILQRRRYVPQINSQDNTLRQFAERVAINTPVQGSAADMIKVAMINVRRRLDRENLKTALVLQVHDELVLDVLEEELPVVKEIVSAEMIGAFKLSVPVEVNIKAGYNWLDLKEV